MNKLLLCAALLALPLLSQATPPPALPATPASAADAMTDAEVRKIDLAAAKLTLRHAEIRSLDMPAMTMVFQARDKRLLDGLKVGDKVRFKAAHEGGQFIVTAIEAAK
ncbi:copper-binding protein [Pelomonas sp. UHG3]|uniref:Copper-binding protein n=1 Tax=Roseateles hydrophilus TaxID=2975054 RepID=A0ACC6CFK3_9BURK|nr:copper-binding protein [Pelomonas sp. UHG3]MCY4747208.1 copper-binding protein [Pelomonas sp. UHG3]